MENLTDENMEFISRDVCTSLGYQCFAKGFDQHHDTENHKSIESQETYGWNLEFFQDFENNELVIWFWDDGGDENYFGEFWLIFDEENRHVAEYAYKTLCGFLRENVENTGKIPPHILGDKLYEIVDAIWGKNSRRFLPIVETRA